MRGAFMDLGMPDFPQYYNMLKEQWKQVVSVVIS